MGSRRGYPITMTLGITPLVCLQWVAGLWLPLMLGISFTLFFKVLISVVGGLGWSTEELSSLRDFMLSLVDAGIALSLKIAFYLFPVGVPWLLICFAGERITHSALEYLEMAAFKENSDPELPWWERLSAIFPRSALSMSLHCVFCSS